MAFAMVGCSTDGAATDSSKSGGDSTQTAQTEEFNPDTEKDSMTIEEVREKFGDVPVKSGLKLGAVEKSLTNEYWRTLQTGYEEAADMIAKASGVVLTHNWRPGGNGLNTFTVPESDWYTISENLFEAKNWQKGIK